MLLYKIYALRGGDIGHTFAMLELPYVRNK
jgi:hypothetical protein